MSKRKSKHHNQGKLIKEQNYLEEHNLRSLDQWITQLPFTHIADGMRCMQSLNKVLNI